MEENKESEYKFGSKIWVRNSESDKWKLRLFFITLDNKVFAVHKDNWNARNLNGNTYGWNFHKKCLESEQIAREGRIKDYREQISELQEKIRLEQLEYSNE